MKQRVWEGMLISDWLSRYYAEIADRKRKVHLGLKFATIIGAVGAATLASADFHPQAGAAVFFGVAVISIVAVVYDFSKEGYIALLNAEQLREVYVEFRQLWYKDALTLEELERLERRIDAVTRDDLLMDYKRSNRCYEEARKSVTDYIGPEPEPGNATTSPASASAT